MSEYVKPLPYVHVETKPFWDGLKRHELQLQKCRDCGKFRFYPRSICPYCLSYDTEWLKVSGRGKIYSFTIAYRPTFRGFQKDVPYNIALIDLDEGVRMVSNIVECRNEDLRIDMPVEAVFDDVTPEITLPRFRPIQQ